MGFFHNSFRARRPLRAGGPIFAVGRRVFVESPGGLTAALTSTDDGAGDTLISLVDGAEVEILAWRPRPSGTVYRVRSARAGIEGWLAAGSVRCANTVIAPSDPPPIRPDGARPRARPAGPSAPRLQKRSAVSARGRTRRTG
jgi:hypothetical protein